MDSRDVNAMNVGGLQSLSDVQREIQRFWRRDWIVECSNFVLKLSSI